MWERAAALTQRYGLASRARAERTIAFAEHYRSYVINYRTGEDVVRAFGSAWGAAFSEARWRAYEGVIAQPGLPEDLQ